MENSTILVWALASASGNDPEKLSALHGTRLEMMLERTIDSPVRGVLYEAVGSLPEEDLATGRAQVERACAKNEIPWAVLESDPSDKVSWAVAAKGQIDELLTRERG